MNGTTQPRGMSKALMITFFALAAVVAICVWQGKLTVPTPSPTTTGVRMSPEAEALDAEVKNWEWRIESATRSGKKAANEGNLELADQWAKHIGEMEAQLESAKKKLKEQLVRDKRKQEAEDERR